MIAIRRRQRKVPRKCPACGEHWLPLDGRWRYPCCIWCVARIHVYAGRTVATWPRDWWTYRYCILCLVPIKEGGWLWAYRIFDDPAELPTTLCVYVAYPDAVRLDDTEIDGLQHLWERLIWCDPIAVYHLRPYIMGLLI